MPYLIYAPGTADETIYDLVPGVNTIGRSGDNRIAVIDESLSRHHATLTVTPDSTTVQDLDSLNNTFVNEVKIERCPIVDGDLIRCGLVTFQFLTSLAPDDGDSALSIIKQVSPQPTETVIQNLVTAAGSKDSVIKLQQESRERRTLDKLRILLEVSKQLCSPEEPTPLLQKILDLLFQLMDIDRAVILIAREDSGKLEAEAVKLKSGPAPLQERFYSHKIADLVFRSGSAILSTDASADRRFRESNSILRQTIHASMCVPLKPHNRAIGVLYVDNQSMPAVYSDEDLEFLTALANQAAVAIHMAREVYKREQKLRAQMAQLQIQIDQAKKEREVAEIVDSDYFKVLQEKAKKLRNARS